jgi:NAD(P)-dependent dehydrogenase (short-subunit alcohol dehydrogenase family)
MARIFVTGSADGLGYATALALLDEGHDVVVHVRSQARLSAVKDLMARRAPAVVGDLADLGQTRQLADQVNAIGPMDAVIHNAGAAEHAIDLLVPES